MVRKQPFAVSSTVVGDKTEKGCEGAKGVPGGNSGKNVPLPQVSKVSSSGNLSILPKTNPTVVLSDDASENDSSLARFQLMIVRMTSSLAQILR